MTELTDREAVQPEDYNDRVAANCKLAANADIEATWTDSTTGKKLYNQAALDAAVLQGRIDENKKAYTEIQARDPEFDREYYKQRLAELEAMQGKGGENG